jgi:hypothetical protein
MITWMMKVEMKVEKTESWKVDQETKQVITYEKKPVYQTCLSFLKIQSGLMKLS